MKNFVKGFSYLFSGARELFSNSRLIKISLIPIVINAVLFGVFIFTSIFLAHRWFGITIPDTWWGILLTVAVFVLFIVVVLFIGLALLTVFGNIIASPFFDALVENSRYASEIPEVKGKFFKKGLNSIKHSLAKLWVFILSHGGLLILYFMPIAIGPISYTVLGLGLTATFLAVDFLDFVFDRKGMNFKQRKDWVLKNKSAVLGFGTAIFFGYTIPIINIFVAPAAVLGAVKFVTSAK